MVAKSNSGSDPLRWYRRSPIASSGRRQHCSGIWGYNGRCTRRHHDGRLGPCTAASWAGSPRRSGSAGTAPCPRPERRPESRSPRDGGINLAAKGCGSNSSGSRAAERAWTCQEQRPGTFSSTMTLVLGASKSVVLGVLSPETRRSFTLARWALACSSIHRHQLGVLDGDMGCLTFWGSGARPRPDSSPAVPVC